MFPVNSIQQLGMPYASETINPCNELEAICSQLHIWSITSVHFR